MIDLGYVSKETKGEFNPTTFELEIEDAFPV